MKLVVMQFGSDGIVLGLECMAAVALCWFWKSQPVPLLDSILQTRE